MWWRFMFISALLAAFTQATPPRAPRQNFYNYRTDFDDDQNYAQFEGDTNGNFVSEFGQRIGARSTAPDYDPQDDPSDYNGLDVDEDPSTDGRRLKTTWTDSTGLGGRDPSYSFGYDLVDQSRHETSDSFGNVNGMYSYIDDEGVYRQISYTAGPGTGFVVRNKQVGRTRTPPFIGHRPPALRIPESPRRPTLGWTEEDDQQLYPAGPTRPTLTELQNQRERPWSSPPRRRKPAYVVKIRRPVKQDPAWAYFRPPNPGRFAPSRGTPASSGGWTPPPLKRPVKVYPTEESFSGGWSESDNSQDSSYPKDASYAFGFDAGDHNRHEVSDPWGNVRGSYSYIDPEGVRRTVHYSASSATGFKILKAEPSNQVSTVYREPTARPRPRPQQPSAFVYHLHPDGGWKPWEASNSRNPQHSNAGKTRRPSYNSVSQSYHYQSQSIGRKGEEIQQQTLLSPTAKRLRRPGTSRGHNHGQKPTPAADEQIDQPYADTDYEIQDDPLKGRFDAQRLDTETEGAESKGPEIRGYQGGYGDKNPLLVVSESASRPRTTDPDNEEQGNKSEVETSTRGPISIGKMMSLRMSKSQKKSSSSRNARKTEGGNNGPTMMSNPGRLVHYPKSHAQNRRSNFE